MRPKVILKKNYWKKDYLKYKRYKTFGYLTQNAVDRLKLNGKKIDRIRERRVLTYIKRKPKTLIFNEQDINDMFKVMLKAMPEIPTKRLIKYTSDFADIQKIGKR